MEQEGGTERKRDRYLRFGEGIFKVEKRESGHIFRGGEIGPEQRLRENEYLLGNAGVENDSSVVLYRELNL